MKRLTIGISVLLLVFLTALPLAAQERGASSGGSDAGRAIPIGSTNSTSSPNYTYGSGSSYSSTSGSYTPAPIGNRAFDSRPSFNSGGASPDLQRTSFYSYDYYNAWNDYFYYLRNYYNLNPMYLSRFYNNREPLMTPALLKITLRQPMFISTEMLKMVDQLEIMLRDSHAGKPVDREDIIAKSQAIRNMAKQIRQNRTLELIDIREKTDVLEGSDFDALSLESIGKLREMALDLNRQLTDMYSMTSTSTISVDSYKQHSFGSVAKGIEKLCKEIENSSGKL
ncbi:MAG: hypothetical protein JXA73_01805 [Acidobacteria bacterium]|nr:hypothetical protein [Acidobacteriota bacterium]